MTKTDLVCELRAAQSDLAEIVAKVERGGYTDASLAGYAVDAVRVGTRVEVAFSEAIDPVTTHYREQF